MPRRRKFFSEGESLWTRFRDVDGMMKDAICFLKVTFMCGNYFFDYHSLFVELVREGNLDELEDLVV
jgi:hypothetical protein